MMKFFSALAVLLFSLSASSQYLAPEPKENQRETKKHEIQAVEVCADCQSASNLDVAIDDCTKSTACLHHLSGKTSDSDGKSETTEKTQ